MGKRERFNVMLLVVVRNGSGHTAGKREKRAFSGERIRLKKNETWDLFIMVCIVFGCPVYTNFTYFQARTRVKSSAFLKWNQ